MKQASVSKVVSHDHLQPIVPQILRYLGQGSPVIYLSPAAATAEIPLVRRQGVGIPGQLGIPGSCILTTIAVYIAGAFDLAPDRPLSLPLV